MPMYDQETKLRVQRARMRENLSHNEIALNEGIPRGSVGYILSDPDVQLGEQDIADVRQAWNDAQDEHGLEKKQFLDLMSGVYPDVPKQAIWNAVNFVKSTLPSVMDGKGIPRFERGVTDA